MNYRNGFIINGNRHTETVFTSTLLLTIINISVFCVLRFKMKVYVESFYSTIRDMFLDITQGLDSQTPYERFNLKKRF